MTVTLSNGATIAIAAGASVGTTVVNASDDAYLGGDTASITIADTFMPGETYLVQRAHRAPNIGPVFNGMASGVALKFRMTVPPPSR